MAITYQVVANFADNDTLELVPSNSFTPDTSKVYLLGAYSDDPELISVTHPGITFTRIFFSGYAESDNIGSMVLFRGECTSATNGACQVYNLDNLTEYMSGFVLEISGCDPVDPFRQVVSNFNTESTQSNTPSVTMGTMISTSATLCIVGDYCNYDIIPTVSGWTSVSDEESCMAAAISNGTGPSDLSTGDVPPFRVHFKNTAETTPTLQTASSTMWVIVALELVSSLRVESIGPKLPLTTAVVAGGATTWTNPNNIKATDGAYATVPIVTSGENTKLDLTGFDFTTGTGALLQYVVPTIVGSASNGPAFVGVQAILNGSPIGTESLQRVDFTSSVQTHTLDRIELMSLGLVTADITNPNFGFRIRMTPNYGVLSVTPMNAAQTGATEYDRNDWTGTGNITTTDGAYMAQSNISSTTANNSYFVASNFGFSISSTATIMGINYAIHGKSSTGTGEIFLDWIQARTGAPGSWTWSNLFPNSNDFWPTSAVSIVDSLDIGANSVMADGLTLTPALVNSSNFAIAGNMSNAGSINADISNTAPSTISQDRYNTGITSTAWVNVANVANATGATMTFTGTLANDENRWNYLKVSNFNVTVTEASDIKDVYLTWTGTYSGSATGAVVLNRVEFYNGSTLLADITTSGSQRPNVTVGTWHLNSSGVNVSGIPSSVWRSSALEVRMHFLGTTAATNRTIKISNLNLQVVARPYSTKIAQIDKITASIAYIDNDPVANTLTLDSAAITAYTSGSITLGSSFSETASVSNVALNRKRDFIASITETLAETFALTVTPAAGGAKTFIMSISETEAIVSALARNRKIALTYAEVEAIASAAIKRARKLVTGFTETEVIAYTRLNRARRLITGFAEVSTQTMTRILRARKLITGFTETETHTLSRISRQRKLASSINEAEVLTVLIQRARKLIVSLSELETINVASIANGPAIKQLVFLIAEVYTQNVSFLTRQRKLVSSIAESEQITEALARFRTMQESINELEAMSASLARDRKQVYNITEVEAINAAFGRIRGVALNLTEVETITANFTRLRKLVAALTETEGWSFSLNRTLKMAFIVNEIETVVLQLQKNQNGGLSFSIDEVELMTAALKRSRNIISSVNEVANLSASLARTRKASFSITETESINVILGRLKLMTATIIENINVTTTGMQRVRGLIESIPQSESYLMAVQRVRNMETVVIENHTAVLDIKRFRGLVSEIVEVQGMNNFTLRRIRGFASDISETLACNVTLTLFALYPNTFQITATFSHWVETSSGVFDLQPETITWEVTSNASNVDLNLPLNEPVTIELQFNGEPGLDLDDLLDGGIL